MEAGAHPASWWGAEEAGERPERGRRMKTGEQTAGRPASLLGGRRLNPFPSPPSLLLPRPHLSPPLPPPLPRPSPSLFSSLHLPRAPHRPLSSPLVSSTSFPSTSSSPTHPQHGFPSRPRQPPVRSHFSAPSSCPDDLAPPARRPLSSEAHAPAPSAGRPRYLPSISTTPNHSSHGPPDEVCRRRGWL